MKLDELIIGKKYIINTAPCYYCGINKIGSSTFELLENIGSHSISLPENWVSKASNTYWAYSGIEKECKLIDSEDYSIESIDKGCKTEIVAPINEFKKDDYIVITNFKMNDDAFPVNYCFKQRQNCEYLSVYFDSTCEENGWDIMRFDKESNYNFDWRYATTEEIAEYNKLGKPFDVTNLTKCVEKEFILPNPWFVHTEIKEEMDVIIQYIEKVTHFKNSGKNYNFCLEGFYSTIPANHTQITFEQFKQYVLKEKPKFKLEESVKYLVRIWPSGTLTMGCKNEYFFKSLETYNKEGGVRIGNSYGLWENKINRNATEEEINYFKKTGTLTSYKIAEKDWSKATKEELLEEAKRRYPIGTKIIGLNTQSIGSNMNCNRQVTIKGPYSIQDNCKIYCYSNVYLYADNKWADIIELPKEEVKESTLDIWLKETKAKNLSLKDLQMEIGHRLGTNEYIKLIGTNVYEKTQILYDLWNSKVEKSIEVIPEYVECDHWNGDLFKKGIIYPVINNRVNNIIGIFSKHPGFVPSTKEAFDLQNKSKTFIKNNPYLIPIEVEEDLPNAIVVAQQNVSKYALPIEVNEDLDKPW